MHPERIERTDASLSLADCSFHAPRPIPGFGLFDQNTLAALQLRFEQVRQNFPHVEFGRATLDALADLTRMPLMTKADCALARLPASPVNALLFTSGGTSNEPTYYFLTPSELCEKGRIGTSLALYGLPDPGRCRYLYLNLMSGGAGWSGGTVCSTGSHPWCVNYSPINCPFNEMIRLVEAVIGSMNDLAGVVVMSSPPSLLKLTTAMHEREAAARWPVLRAVYGAGPLTLSQSARIRETFPGATVHSILSSSEGNAYGFSHGEDCQVHTVLPESCFFWLRDEETGEPVEAPGRTGEMVVSNLYCGYYPLNFLSNDRAEWIVPYDTFRLRGRRRDVLSFAEGGIRLEGAELAEIIMQRCGGEACQIHVIPDRRIEVVVLNPRCILDQTELQQALIVASGCAYPDMIRTHFAMSMRAGDPQRTAAGKIPLVIDNREV